MRILLIAMVLLAGFCASAQDKILFNGTIYTMNEAQPTAEAILVRDGSIVALGSVSDLRKQTKGNAAQIDLHGGYLIPGLVDSHNHAIGGGESLANAMLGDVVLTKEQMIAFASDALKTGRGLRGDVLYLGGAHSGQWAASNELDEIFNQSPYEKQSVAIMGSDGHTGWVNRAMLKKAGIDKKHIESRSAEERKFYGVNTDGEPNGLLSEDAVSFARSFIPPVVIDKNRAGEMGVQFLNSLGITAWLDPAAGDIKAGTKNKTIAVYRYLSDNKKLTARVSAVVTANGNTDTGSQIEVIKALQNENKATKNLTILGFKIFADGVLEYPTQTAAISIPYKNSGSTGSLMFEPARFNEFVAAADKAGLLVHVHTLGDRAVTETLNAFEYARKMNGKSGVTHSVTHLQLVKPSDFPRFAALDVMTSLQLLWATPDTYTVDLVKPYIDETLYAHQYPGMSLLRAGCRIAGASDWPVSSANPFEAIAMAETRTGRYGVLDSNEVISRKEMMKAYTIRAAELIHLDKQIGSIEPGKKADLVLLDRDVMTVAPESVKKTAVIWTMFDGEIVYQRK